MSVPAAVATAGAMAAPLPSEQCGVLEAHSRAPLSLTGCTVAATVDGAMAHVRLSMTYKNELGKDVPVVAAVPSPVDWAIVNCSVRYDGRELRSVFVPTSGADLEAKASATDTAGHGSSVAAAAAGVVVTAPTAGYGGVVSVPLPLTVSVGTAITITTVYLVPVAKPSATTLSGRFDFTIPAELIPAVHRPSAVKAAYAGVFSIASRGAEENEGNGVLRLRVSARLVNALRGEVAVTTADPVSGGLPIPVDCEVAYESDAQFSCECVLPLPGSSSDSPYRGGAIRVSCCVQDTIEPLRLYTEQITHGNSDDSEVAVEALLSAVSLDATVVNSEYIFIIDSHNAVSSAAAGHALFVALRALPASVRVNVAVLRDGGGHNTGSSSGGAKADTSASYRLVYPAGSPQVRSVNLNQLKALVAELTPQQQQQSSSSPLLPVIAALLPSSGRTTHLLPRVTGYLRHVVILSDGAAVAEGAAPATVAAFFRAVRDATPSSRVSAVAVTAENTVRGQHGAAGLALLEVLAREGNGLLAEATEPDAVTAALVAVLAATAVPTLIDVALRLGGDDLAAASPSSSSQLSRHAVPAIPSGAQYAAYALVRTAAASVVVNATARVGDCVMELNGNSNDIPTATAADSDGDNNDHVSILARSAAAARVRSLRTAGDGRTEVGRVSAKYGVPSSCARLALITTSGGVDGNDGDSAIPVTGHCVPASVAEGARFIFELTAARRRWTAVLAARLVAPPASQVNSASHAHRTLDAFVGFHGAWATDSTTTTTATATAAAVEALLLQQEADGGFHLSDGLAAAIGVALEAIEAAEPVRRDYSPKQLMDAHAHSTWATVVALDFLRESRQPIGALAVLAATRCLEHKDRSAELRDWLLAARDLRRGGA